MKKHNNIKITFGIPAYNASKTITKLLECFEHTKEYNYEIIIVDDGSDDATYDAIMEFVKKNSIGIRVIKTKHLGVSNARNIIIKSALGEWLTFIDADDLIIFRKYTQIIMELPRESIDYCICMSKRVNKNSIPSLISNELLNSPWAKFYKTSVLKENNILFPNDLDLGEDLVFNLRYLLTCKDYIIIPSNPYVYVYTDDSLTRKHRDNKYEVLMRANDLCRKAVSEALGHDVEIEKSLEFIRIKNCASCLRAETNSQFDNSIKKMKKNNPRRYWLMNSFSETVLYNAWFILPSCVIRMMMGCKNA